MFMRWIKQFYRKTLNLMNFKVKYLFALLLNIIDRFIFIHFFWNQKNRFYIKLNTFFYYRDQYTNNSFIGEYFKHYSQTKKKNISIHYKTNNIMDRKKQTPTLNIDDYDFFYFDLLLEIVLLSTLQRTYASAVSTNQCMHIKFRFNSKYRCVICEFAF